MEWRKYFWRSKSKHKHVESSDSSIDWVDPSKTTQQERDSRKLHAETPTKKKKKELMYDQFFIIGLNSSGEFKPEGNEAKTLFKYPQDIDTFPGIEDIVFPSGVKCYKAPQGASIYQILSSQTQMSHSENSFICLLTSEKGEMYFGMCMTLDEPIDCIPSVAVSDLSHLPSPTVLKEATIKSIPTHPSITSSNPTNTSYWSGWSSWWNGTTTTSNPHPPVPKITLPPSTSDTGRISYDGSATVHQTRPRSNSLEETSSHSTEKPSLPTATKTNSLEIAQKKWSLVSKRCYCVVSRYPFFDFHFEVLQSIVAMEHTFHVSSFQLSENMETEGFKVDLDWEQLVKTQRDTLFMGLENYYTLPVPAPGQTLKFSPYLAKPEIQSDLSVVTTVPSSPGKAEHPTLKPSVSTPDLTMEKKMEDSKLSKSASKVTLKPQAATNPSQFTYLFSRPVMDEQETALVDWGLPTLMYSLPQKWFFKVFNACLLEKSIVFVSSSLRVLSSVILSLIPLFKPFNYQSAIIPILPNRLYPIFDAPMPFIVGVTSLPDNVPKSVITFNLDTQTANFTQQIPELPKLKEFLLEFNVLFVQLSKTFGKGMPSFTTSKQLIICKQIRSQFEKYLSSLFSTFRHYCIRDLTQRDKPVTLFLKDCFVESMPYYDRAWYTLFMETQIFFQFSDGKLRTEDLKINPNIIPKKK